MAIEDAHEMHILNTEDVIVYIWLVPTFSLNDLQYISFALIVDIFIC